MQQNQVALGEFLRRRRDALRPVDVGLDAEPGRRTVGLRRAEVAAIARISTNYYERLEQARAPVPSASVLAGIADALRLTVDEQAYLFLLAGRATPHEQPPAEVDGGLRGVMAALGPTTAAFIADDLGTILVQNPLNVALFGRFAGLPGYAANRTWRWFTDPEWRARLGPAGDEDATGAAYVADLRANATRRGPDAQAATLIRRLRTASELFARMWDEHRVAPLRCSSVTVLVDERVGRLELTSAVVLGQFSHQRLSMVTPVADTDTARRLGLLAKLIAAGTDNQSVPDVS